MPLPPRSPEGTNFAWLRQLSERLLSYFRNAFYLDLRSAIVGTVVGSIVGAVAVACTRIENIEHVVFTDQGGTADPLVQLTGQLEFDEEPAYVELIPEDLIGMRVCESAYLAAPSYRLLLLQYVDRYSMCLDLSATDKNRYEIRVNNRSGAVSQSGDGTWLCKCPQQVKK